MKRLSFTFFFLFFLIACGNAEDVASENYETDCVEQDCGQCEECPECSSDVIIKYESDPCEGMVQGEACIKEYCLDGNCSFVKGLRFCEDGEYICYASCSPVENCNTPEIDENCNGLTNEGCDEVADTDEDGDPDETDCAPKNPDVSHFATEQCNEIDDDCDDETDEDFNLKSDVNNCGQCGNKCGVYEHAAETCFSGKCQFLSCLAEFTDLNNDIGQENQDGCECHEPTGEGCVCLETAPNAISHWVYDEETMTGSCEMICVGGYSDDNEDMSDGCECDLVTGEGCLPVEVELVAGDIIAIEGDEGKYYYAEDGNRYTFPYDFSSYYGLLYDDAIIESWFPYGYEVKMLSMEQMVQIPLAGNVTIRPGTWLVRITTAPKVYAIEPGSVLRQVADQTVLENLFSQIWEAIAPTKHGFALLQIVPDAFWSNYFPGEPLDGTVHPTGTLVYCFAFSLDVYYIDEGSKRLVTDWGFIENNFATQFVIPLNTETCSDYLDGLPDGDPIQGWEYELSLDYDLLNNYGAQQ